MQTPPDRLYKYRSFDAYSESWIVNDELYFAKASSFNDPFDCKVNLSVEATSDDLFSYARKRDVIKSLPKKERSRAAKALIKAGLLEDPTSREAHANKILKTLDDYGVLSLTEKRDDILMFAHYANCHRGYCLEFTCSGSSYLHTVEQVRYSHLYPQVRFFKMNSIEIVRAITLTKSQAWSYEKDWRCFQKPAGLRKVKKSILTGIIFGCQMSENDKQAIRALNGQRQSPAKLFQAETKKDEFGLMIKALEN